MNKDKKVEGGGGQVPQCHFKYVPFFFTLIGSLNIKIFIQSLFLKKTTSIISTLKSDQNSFVCSTQSLESRGQCGINLCDIKKHLGNILYLSCLHLPLNLRNLNLTFACHCRSTSWFQLCLKFNCQLLIGNCCKV